MFDEIIPINYTSVSNYIAIILPDSDCIILYLYEYTSNSIYTMNHFHIYIYTEN